MKGHSIGIRDAKLSAPRLIRNKDFTWREKEKEKAETNYGFWGCWRVCAWERKIRDIMDWSFVLLWREKESEEENHCYGRGWEIKLLHFCLWPDDSIAFIPSFNFLFIYLWKRFWIFLGSQVLGYSTLIWRWP